MAIKYDFNENNKKATERSETTYKPQTPVKNTVDNSDSVRYNKDRKNTAINTPVTNLVKQWKEKNEELFKYSVKTACAYDNQIASVSNETIHLKDLETEQDCQ